MKEELLARAFHRATARAGKRRHEAATLDTFGQRFLHARQKPGLIEQNLRRLMNINLTISQQGCFCVTEQ